MLAEEEFKGGNIKTDRIKDILNSEIFKEVASFSSLTNEDCSICPIKLLCGGACRARSYAETGSLFKNSEFCSYEKLAYINGIFENSEF
ncbi:MAG: SPASM domain-containing protein [Sulfurimonas sp.]|uniref:SPASM domain-containing protein n=1 Tax=Sulfurimonas sp. TaxID=2022749 RepID=UPI00261F927C|nr:SPASM domain-containing protein [Sulfurimonas sp.]MDD5371873.1 SPASM domain-containing protein [Sulfurimonas sp.]